MALKLSFFLFLTALFTTVLCLNYYLSAACSALTGLRTQPAIGPAENLLLTKRRAAPLHAGHALPPGHSSLGCDWSRPRQLARYGQRTNNTALVSSSNTGTRCGSNYRVLFRGEQVPGQCPMASTASSAAGVLQGREAGPCCSDHGYCGISPAHCLCPDCVDYRKAPHESWAQGQLLANLRLFEESMAKSSATVPYVLTGGTLLGWFRDCDILLGTSDLDVGIDLASFDVATMRAGFAEGGSVWEMSGEFGSLAWSVTWSP